MANIEVPGIAVRGEGGSPEIAVVVATGKEASEPKTYILLVDSVVQCFDRQLTCCTVHFFLYVV